MINFKLNGKKVQGEEGQYILQVAEKYGVEIPTLCHHKALEPRRNVPFVHRGAF
jgi:heterodisulfide reductase subunit A